MSGHEYRTPPKNKTKQNNNSNTKIGIPNKLKVERMKKEEGKKGTLQTDNEREKKKKKKK